MHNCAVLASSANRARSAATQRPNCSSSWFGFGFGFGVGFGFGFGFGLEQCDEGLRARLVEEALAARRQPAQVEDHLA